MDQVQMSKRELERYTVMRQIEEQLISRRQAALALNLSERQVRSRGLGFKKTRSHDLTARIINKFASEDEKVLCTDNPKEWYLQLWCAKEAIYKLVGIENLSFKNEIHVYARLKKAETTFLSAIVQQGTQKHDIDVQICETSDLQIAVAKFKAAP